MKKILLYIVTAVFALSLFTGCTSTYDTTKQLVTTYDKHDISTEALEYAESIVVQDGVYTTPAMVAAYLHTFNKLPSNFITKKEAQQLGWNNKEGNLHEVAPGKSIGGDHFGNYEELLPKQKKYKECDVNYESGRRNAERIIFSTDGDIYYTDDHYENFKKLY